MNNPIGIFDSGIGGLTVFKEISKALPSFEIIYLGDTARLPYGIKSKRTIDRYSINNVKLLKSLEEKPSRRWLRKIHECEDEKALKFFLRDKNLENIKLDKDKLSLLWECCQIPDFVKKTYGNHYELSLIHISEPTRPY